jgi:hypothetical protein
MRLRLARNAEFHLTTNRQTQERYNKYIVETEEAIRIYEEFIRDVNRQQLGFAPSEVPNIRQELDRYRRLSNP